MASMTAIPNGPAAIQIGAGFLIPIKAYKATSETKTSFNSLHTCGVQAKKPYWCPQCAKHVTEDELVKGWPLAKDGPWVKFTDEELASIKLKSNRVIELVTSFPAGELDPRQVDESLFLAPQDIGVKGYAMLHYALSRTGLFAVGKFVRTNREKVGIVRPFEGVLLFQLLRYPDELRDWHNIPVPKGQTALPTSAVLSDREKDLGQRLMLAMSGPLELSQFHDGYHAAVMELVAVKQSGGVIEAPQVEALPAPSTDMAAMLEAQLASFGPAQVIQQAEAVAAAAPVGWVVDEKGKPTGELVNAKKPARKTKKAA